MFGDLPPKFGFVGEPIGDDFGGESPAGAGFDLFEVVPISPRVAERTALLIMWSMSLTLVAALRSASNPVSATLPAREASRTPRMAV